MALAAGVVAWPGYCTGRLQVVYMSCSDTSDSSDDTSDLSDSSDDTSDLSDSSDDTSDDTIESQKSRGVWTF